VEEPYVHELQDIFEDLLSHTPNLRHPCVPAGHFTKFLNPVLKEEDYLTSLESFESYDGPYLKYNPLQCWSSIFRLKRLLSLSITDVLGWCILEWKPGILYLNFKEKDIFYYAVLLLRIATLSYVTLARLIQSCGKLE
jgi:hypothetical protein